MPYTPDSNSTNGVWVVRSQRQKGVTERYGRFAISARVEFRFLVVSIFLIIALGFLDSDAGLLAVYHVHAQAGPPASVDRQGTKEAASTTTPTLALVPSWGHIGDVFEVYGTGFHPNYGIGVNFGYGQTCIAGTTEDFSCTKVVPGNATPGSYTVTASDGTHTASATFIVLAPGVVGPMPQVYLPLVRNDGTNHSASVR
jgi:hypothetical protein